MKRNKLSRMRQNGIIKLMFIFLVLLSSTSLTAQTPTNFSGKWEFDKSNSDEDEKGEASFDGIIVLEIKQNSDTISFCNTFFLPGREGQTLRPLSFPANGEETVDDSGFDSAKKFVRWSHDNTVLTTNYIMTASIDGVALDFLTATTYKFSEDEKTLIVEELKKSIYGEKTIKKIYKKK